MPAGRPLKFTSKEKLEVAIDKYFKSCEDDQGKQIKPISITGLALALDTSRETLCNYEGRDEFFDTIKRAKLRVENYYEENLSLKNSTGSIFALKNFGWRDTQDVNHGGQGKANPVMFEHPLTDEILKRYVEEKCK